MQKLLITTHMHVLALIVGVIVGPWLVSLYRRRRQKSPFTSEQNNKLRLDLATLVPVAVLLWNLSMFYLANVLASGAEAGHASGPPAFAAVLTFEKAVAAAGESTVALATAIIFCRLCGG